MRVKLLVVIVFMACAVGAYAQQPHSPWTGARGGQIPDGAVAYGREADGRDQFICRGAYQGGTHIGKIASGFGGCNIGYGGREITLSEYEVFCWAGRQRNAAAAEFLSAAASAFADGR